MACNNCVTHKDYYSEQIYTWCTNCGNYGIHEALKRALVSKQIEPSKVLLCFDIGCHGNGADKIQGYRFHGLHGRVIPFAVGAHLANTQLPVIAMGGDGATFGEGINHLIHAIRSDYNITFILHNNSNYGLTKGQASPSTKQGERMNSSPDGVVESQLNSLELVLTLNPSFVARTFSGNFHQMQSIFEAGIAHNGFSYIEVLQACPTYNKTKPHKWYMQNTFDTIELSDYDNSNLSAAKHIVSNEQEKIATGILYHKKDNVDYYSRLSQRQNVKTTLVEEV